jgi:hypothetical protein
MWLYWFLKVQRWLTYALATVAAFYLFLFLGLLVLRLDSTLGIAFAILGLIVAAFSALVARRAASKGKSAIAFFFLSLLISPLITWLIVESLAEQVSSKQFSAEDQNEYKLCPFCAEPVRAQAIKCKHCGSEI